MCPTKLHEVEDGVSSHIVTYITPGVSCSSHWQWKAQAHMFKIRIPLCKLPTDALLVSTDLQQLSVHQTLLQMFWNIYMAEKWGSKAWTCSFGAQINLLPPMHREWDSYPGNSFKNPTHVNSIIFFHSLPLERIIALLLGENILHYNSLTIGKWLEILYVAHHHHIFHCSSTILSVMIKLQLRFIEHLLCDSAKSIN